MDNIFKECNDDSSIMKKMFDVYGDVSSNYTREELTKMANDRRLQLKSSTQREKSIITKINIPQPTNKSTFGVIPFKMSANPMGSRVFEFCEDRSVYF